MSLVCHPLCGISLNFNTPLSDVAARRLILINSGSICIHSSIPFFVSIRQIDGPSHAGHQKKLQAQHLRDANLNGEQSKTTTVPRHRELILSVPKVLENNLINRFVFWPLIDQIRKSCFHFTLVVEITWSYASF